MNCRSCDSPKDAHARRQAALKLIHDLGELSKDEQDKAMHCLECAADIIATDATKRIENEQS